MKETAYLLQAALICAWWVGLASSPAFFSAFQFDGVPPTAFWSFAAPDLSNPMAIAGIGQGLAIALMFESLSILVYSILGAFVWHLVVRPIEERDLAKRFGDAYLNYRKRVLCWIPRFRQNAS